MNPGLARLRPYPFERLAALLEGIAPPPGTEPIALHIGEPRHPAPAFVLEELAARREGYSRYPKTAGEPWLREAMAAWLGRRFALGAGPDPAREVLPVNGTREALFAFTQCVAGAGDRVAIPNPFYQVYEGAALLAGATPLYLPERADRPGVPDLRSPGPAGWRGCRLLVLCSPANPSGAVLGLEDWREVLELADREGLVVAADECYSELYDDESAPPVGLLQACRALGREDFRGCIAFHSLSKRSSLPGLRSGLVAGDAALIREFLRYRTYHGSAMPLPHQHASAVAWGDEAHVVANRAAYRAKFDIALEALGGTLDCERPAGAFYLWPRVPGDEQSFARELYRATGVTVLPGSFLSRPDAGGDPGAGRIRIALVGSEAETADAMQRLRDFAAAWR